METAIRTYCNRFLEILASRSVSLSGILPGHFVVARITLEMFESAIRVCGTLLQKEGAINQPKGPSVISKGPFGSAAFFSEQGKNAQQAVATTTHNVRRSKLASRWRPGHGQAACSSQAIRARDMTKSSGSWYGAKPVSNNKWGATFDSMHLAGNAHNTKLHSPRHASSDSPHKHLASV